MKVFLGIPFRDDGHRLPIFEKLLPFIKNGYDFEWCHIVDSGDVPFSRAATRNLIVQHSLDVGADIVVINDADSICEPSVLQEAIVSAHHDNRLHIPFNKVNVCGSGKLGHRKRHPTTLRPAFSYGPSCGGVYVIRPSRWELAGGQDERIKGWGFEDECWIVAVNNTIGGYDHHEGSLYTFQHPREHIDTFRPENIQIRDRYHALDGNYIGLRKYRYGSSRFC